MCVDNSINIIGGFLTNSRDPEFGIMSIDDSFVYYCIKISVLNFDFVERCHDQLKTLSFCYIILMIDLSCTFCPLTLLENITYFCSHKYVQSSQLTEILNRWINALLQENYEYYNGLYKETEICFGIPTRWRKKIWKNCMMLLGTLGLW